VTAEPDAVRARRPEWDDAAVRWAAGTLAATLFLTGCSGGGAGTGISRHQGVPVLDGATKESGTKLGNGFTVAPGSVLIGDVFPTGAERRVGDRTLEDRGWHAFLLVTGDPAQVLAHYQREAEDATMPLRAYGSDTSTPAPMCKIESVEGYVCRGAGYADEDDRARSFSLTIVRRMGDGRSGLTSIPQSYATLQYRDQDALTSGRSSYLVSPLPGPEPPTLPTDWPALARSGDHIDSGIPRAGPLTLEPQSRAVIAPIVEEGNVGLPRPNVILRIDGGPMAVLRAYQRQFVRVLERLGAGPTTRPIRRRIDDGVTVFDLNVIADSAIRLTAFARKGEPTWAILSTDVDV
jgi:hypothetical protein